MQEQQLVNVYDHFRASVHWPYLAAAMRGLVRAYRTAADVIEEHAPDREGLEALPHFKRALVDQMLRFEAKKFPNHVRAESVPNSVGNSFHTEVYAGGFTLTAHYIATSAGGARSAKYREELADNSAHQLELFGPPQIPPDAELYGHILHGSDGRNQGRVDYVYVKFPLPGTTGYASVWVDLIAEFPEIFGRSSSDVSHIADDAVPALLPQQTVGNTSA